ncbi:MAG: hypothetical protein WC565_05180 [Parcubacteria group bacterium]
MNLLSIPFPFLVIIIVALFFVLSVIFVAEKIRKNLGLGRVNSSMIRMPYSKSVEEALKQVIAETNFPVALDIVVEHIGKIPDVYITTEKKYFSRLIKLAERHISGKYELREEDYLIFHHGGETQALTCELERDDALKTDLSAIDMSEVNEIGEGAVVRMVFVPHRKTNIYMFFSAPSQFQLREIVEKAAATFKGKGCRVPKNREVTMAEFNSPDFLYKAAK